MAVGAHPLAKPRAPSSFKVTLKPWIKFLYLAWSTCRRHLTKSSGVNRACVEPGIPSKKWENWNKFHIVNEVSAEKLETKRKV